MDKWICNIVILHAIQYSFLFYRIIKDIEKLILYFNKFCTEYTCNSVRINMINSCNARDHIHIIRSLRGDIQTLNIFYIEIFIESLEHRERKLIQFYIRSCHKKRW